MKLKKLLSLVLTAVITVSSTGISPMASMLVEKDNAIRSIITESKRSIPFNEEWKFNLGDVQGAKDKSFDDNEWRQLSLPHDWSIELDFNRNSPATHEGGFLDGGTGWYRKTFVLPKEMEGKEISIAFEGVYMDSYVYVNGTQVGNHPYGYTPFSFNITDNLVCDGVTENVIAVKVNNQQPSSRWYSGSGIYRDVNLTVTEKVHVKEYGTYITTPNLAEEYKNGNAKVNIETDIANKENSDKAVSVKSTIIDAMGNIVGENVTTETVATEGTKKYNAEIDVSNPMLWGTENPYLYTLVTTVIIDNKIVDEYETEFGIRWFEMTNNDGFFLNGEQMKLEGVCMHHDQGALGAIDNKASIRRQVKMLKDMGVNSIRVTHNPASPNLIDICNEEGILLVEEAFDCWYSGKKAYDYGRFFERKSIHGDMTWGEFDIKQMVNRGKNAPSIIMWSLGNEVWVSNQEKGVETTKQLDKWVKEIDDTRPTTYGESLFQLGNTGEGDHEKSCNEVDTVGFNYGDMHYDFFHEKYPEWIIYGSETSSGTRSRGEYAHPEQTKVMDNHTDLQQSSYDNDHVAWGRTAESAWKVDRDRAFVLGQYIWTGFDYIGEPTPYGAFPAKSSYFGAIDTAGFEKDIFYFYQSQWSDEPMVHLLPHWNWENDDSIKVDGDKILVYAYTNANTVDIYFNEDVTSEELGSLVESKSYEITNAGYNGNYKETKDGKLHLEFRVPYRPGKLTAVAKDADGNEIATDVVKTANEAKGIDLSADRQVITADGYDLSFITVDVVDENGTLVPDADNLINFEVKGNGKIVGVDNGNAASVERYKDSKREAYNGKALVIVQSTKTAGSFTLTATSQGLKSDNIAVYTVPEDELNENKIVGYDVNDVIVPVNGELNLPSEITALYTDGSKSEVKVLWEEISEDKLQRPGIFKVAGTVIDSDVSVSINIIVKDIIGVLDSRMLVAVGTASTLPSEVSVVSNDGSIEKQSVTWERQLTLEDTQAAGTIKIEGVVTGSNLKAKAIIVVSDNYEEKNVALSTGKEYPKAFASYTGGDSVSTINDGIISKGNSPKNRWTNWGKPGENYDDFVGIEFGREYTISEIGISLYKDWGLELPSEIIVEYWNGTTWLPVSNQSKTNNFSEVGTEHITFDQVTTSKIRAQLKENTEANKGVGITELEVYSNVLIMEGTALLKNIKVNNEIIENFSESTREYIVDLPYGADIPKVTATAKDNASTFVVPALDVDSNSTIIVIAEDGRTTNNYIVNFNESDPALVSATIELARQNIIEDDIVEILVEGTLQDNTILSNDKLDIKYNLTSEGTAEAKVDGNRLYAYTEGTVVLSAEVSYKGTIIETEPLVINISKNPVDKTIISYEKVNVITDKGVAPVLPGKVKATFDVGLPREVKVTWEKINENDYNKYGVFEVLGIVEGQDLRVRARVIVKGISALENVSMATNVGVEPMLPEKVKAYYTDGTTIDVPVSWEPYDEELLRNVGSFVIEGTVDNCDLVVKANIRVSDETVLGDNIAGFKNGFTLPLAISSFTNPVPNDTVTHLNDNNDSTRWTNWQPISRDNEWIGVIFGTGMPEQRYINNMQVNFFEDFGCKIPKNIEIQYYVGDDISIPGDAANVAKEGKNPLNDDNNWKAVDNLVLTPNSPVANGATNYSFDMVKTYALRAKMISVENKAIGINEIRAFEERVEPNRDFTVNNIKINDSELEGFATDRYNYTIKLKVNEDIPKITVDTTNNAAVSIVYTVDSSENLEVIVKSENALTEVKYYIALEREVYQDEVDKTALKMAIDYALDIETNGGLEGVVPVIVQEFKDALDKANHVYNDVLATTIQVDEVFIKLVNVIHMLEFKAGDKNQLSRQIEIAKTLVSDKYTEESWSYLQMRLEDAIKVYEDENALEQEVNDVYNRLVEAINRLEIKPIEANKDNLKNIMDKIEALNKEEYIPSTWAKVEERLKIAKAIYDKENSTQAEVDNAYEGLLRVYLELRLKPDKSKLENLISKAEDIDLSKYTETTASTFKIALKNAIAVFSDEEASKEEVSKVTSNLELAMANLEEKNDNSNSGNIDKDIDVNSNNTNTTKPSTSNKLPSTGAVVSSTIILLIGVAAVVGGAVTFKKRKKNK